MHILAIDTALEACSAAVCAGDGTVRARECVPMRTGHAEALVPMIGRVMAAAGLSFAGLDRLAVTVGPGTFTGLRVGMAAARGLALAAGIPLAGVGTLEALAAGVVRDRPAGEAESPFVVALDARRGEVYGQAFAADGTPAGAPGVFAPAPALAVLGAAAALLCGGGAPLLADALRAQGHAPRLSGLALPPGPDPVMVARLAAGRPPPEHPPSLLYLRPPDAKPQAGAAMRAGPPAARP